MGFTFGIIKKLVVGVKSGPVMAAADMFYIDIEGIGGHGGSRDCRFYCCSFPPSASFSNHCK